MRYREIEKKLKLGCLEIKRKGGGSHRKWYNPNQNRIVIVAVPDWGQRTLRRERFEELLRIWDSNGRNFERV